MYVSALSSTTDLKMEGIKKEPLLDYTVQSADHPPPVIHTDPSRYPLVYPTYDQAQCYTTIAYPTSHQPTVYTAPPFRGCARPLSPLTLRPSASTTSTTSPDITTTSSTSSRCSMSPSCTQQPPRNITMPADTTTLHTSPVQTEDKTELSPTAGNLG